MIVLAIEIVTQVAHEIIVAAHRQALIPTEEEQELISRQKVKEMPSFIL